MIRKLNTGGDANAASIDPILPIDMTSVVTSAVKPVVASAAAVAAIAYIGIGSNMQNPIQQIKRAYAEINEIEGTTLTKASSFYVTSPIGFLAQSDFINAVIAISTSLTPQQLLKALLDIEAKHHRLRINRNGPRTLDLDILLFDQQQLSSPALTLPHPRAHLRAFVLHPLFEIAPHLLIPGQSAIRSLLESVADQQIRRLLDEENVADEIAEMDGVSLKNGQTRSNNTPIVNHEI